MLSPSPTTRLVPLAQGVHGDVILLSEDDGPGPASSLAESRPPATSSESGDGCGEAAPLSLADPSAIAAAAATNPTSPTAGTAASISEDALLAQAARGRVCKLVNAPKSGTAKARRPHDVVREVRVLERLHHPNVVPLLDYTFDESRLEHTLTLPLLAANLSSVLQQPVARTHPMQMFVHTAAGLFEGLAHLHATGLAHRDVNPANIMFAFDGTPVLIDFGTAWDGDKRGDGGGSMSCAVGTIPYRAPELLFSPTMYDAAAVDLWSAGTTLAEFFRPRDDGAGTKSTRQRKHGKGTSTSQAMSGGAPISASASGETPSAVDEDLTVPTHTLEQSFAQLGVQEAPAGPPIPLFSAAFGELGLAASIFRLLGTPTPESWPSFTSLPDAGKIAFDIHPACPLREALVLDMSGDGAPTVVDVLEHLVCLEPAARRGAAATLAALTQPILAAAGQAELLRPLLVNAARRLR